MYSIDYLIGEPEYLRKGYGKEMVRLLRERLSDLGVKCVVAQPDKNNTSSRNVLEANGYKNYGEYYALMLKPDTARKEYSC
jgi:RimJ/RimL family protein N-acetyltransferase